MAPFCIIASEKPLSSPQVSSIPQPQARIFLFLFIFLVFCNHAILSCRLSSLRSHRAPRASKSTSHNCFFHLWGLKRPKCIKGFYVMAHFRWLHRGLDISSLIKPANFRNLITLSFYIASPLTGSYSTGISKTTKTVTFNFTPAVKYFIVCCCSQLEAKCIFESRKRPCGDF